MVEHRVERIAEPSRPQRGILMVGVGLLALVLAGQRRRPGTAEMPDGHASGPKPA